MELYKRGWRFIGVVKTATRNFPKEFLSSVELTERGLCAGLKTKHSCDQVDLDLMAFVYCDRDRHYFISSCLNIAPGQPIDRVRVRQVAAVETNESPERVALQLNCPKAAETYYLTCGKIDQHNRCRQSTLKLEKSCASKHGTNVLISPSLA